MIWQFLAPWWIIFPATLIGLGAIGWQIYLVRLKGRPVITKWLRRAALPVLLALLALGPSLPVGSPVPGAQNLDVIFAVDTTASMGSEDYAGNKLRLDGVKHDLLALSRGLAGAHLELITFDSTANVVLPFTTNTTTFTSAVQTMEREVYSYSSGSAIDKPIDLLSQQLKNSQSSHPERSRLLFYLGDGEQTSNAPVKSFATLAPYLSGGAVLGYGTLKGAKIVKYSGTGNASATDSYGPYVTTIDPKTNTFIPAISKLDETALKKIAGQIAQIYQNRNNGGQINSLLKASKSQHLIDTSIRSSRYLNLYWLFAIPFAGLLFWEWKDIVLLELELGKNKGNSDA
jgi:Ca-activated chloride channel family protein